MCKYSKAQIVLGINYTEDLSHYNIMFILYICII